MENMDAHQEELLSWLNSDDIDKRESACIQLREYDNDISRAALVALIEDSNKGIREVAAEGLISLGGERTALFLSDLLGNEDISVRNLAAETLAKLGSASIDPLVEKVNDPDKDIRKFAVDILGLIGDSCSFEAVQRALDDENPNVVCSAAEALGEIGDPRAVAPLVRVLKENEDACLQAAEALGKIGDETAFDALVQGLDTDDAMVIFSIIDAMGNMKNPKAAPYLRSLLETADDALKEAIINSLIKLAKYSGREILEDLPVKQLQDCLFNALSGENKDNKIFALRELEHWEGPTVVEKILFTLNDPDEEVRSKAKEVLKTSAISCAEKISSALQNGTPEYICDLLETIAASGNSRFVADVIGLAGSENPSVREEVAWTLGKIGDRSALDSLFRLAEDDLGHVRSAAIKSIGWVGDERDIDKLLHWLDDQYPDVREACLGALVLIGGNRVIENFRKDLNHPEVERQKMAARALGWIGEKEVVEPLISALNHPEWEVRRFAVESLGRIADKRCLEPLKVALNDDDAQVRKSAIDAVIDLEGKAASKSILMLLDDPDIWVRFHAINVISTLGDSTASEKILPMLSDENDIIRVAAAKAMTVMKDRRSLSVLRNIINDPNRDVAEAASQAVAVLEGRG